MDFTIKYRPGSFKDMVGQQAVVSSIKSALAKTREGGGTFLFHGSSGVGKTTAARIVAMAVNCESNTYGENPCGSCDSCKLIREGRSEDVKELNTSKDRGIDVVRSVMEQFNYLPTHLTHKVLILDECHGLTSSAQNALLEFLEDPKGVYVILCSTEPDKLIKTVRNRSMSFTFKPVKDKSLLKAIDKVSVAEGLDIDQKIKDKIVSVSKGCVREALKILQMVASESVSDGDVDLLINHISDDNGKVIELCRKINNSASCVWADVMKVYKSLEVTDPYALTNIICSYFRKVLENASSNSDGVYASRTLEVMLTPLPSMSPENMFVLNLYKAYKINKDKKRVYNSGNVFNARK